jgi:hypothetical protein
MKGIRHFLRDFTATAVREHPRSAIEDTGGSPDLTKNEIELVRFIWKGSVDWDGFPAERSDAAMGNPHQASCTPRAQAGTSEQTGQLSGRSSHTHD